MIHLLGIDNAPCAVEFQKTDSTLIGIDLAAPAKAILT
jgi:hypothetical protein